jgi:ATP-dependent exoDNAse (exonuclease V) beta subunit
VAKIILKYSIDKEIYQTMSLLLFFVHNPNESSYLHNALSSPKMQEGTDNQEILCKNKYHHGSSLLLALRHIRSLMIIDDSR